MNLTRIAELPGMGAGAVAAYRLEDDPKPQPVRVKQPEPAKPSMAHLDIDPDRMAKVQPLWGMGNPPPAPSAPDEDFARYLLDYQRHTHDVNDPGHCHDPFAHKFFVQPRDPGKVFNPLKLGEVQLRVDRLVAEKIMGNPQAAHDMLMQAAQAYAQEQQMAKLKSEIRKDNVIGQYMTNGAAF